MKALFQSTFFRLAVLAGAVAALAFALGVGRWG
jgi:hypothetical protein